MNADLTFQELKRALKADADVLPEIRLALLGDSALQLFATALKATAIRQGFRLNVYEGGHGRIESELLDEQSPLHAFRPDAVLVCISAEKLLAQFYAAPATERPGFAAAHLSRMERLAGLLRERINTPLLLLNLRPVDDGVWGNAGFGEPQSFRFQAQQINAGLAALATRRPDCLLVDAAAVAERLGSDRAHNPALYVNTDMVWDLDALSALAARAFAPLAALRGSLVKCLVFDLDNTIWGGVIGDDGLEKIEIGALGIGKAFSGLQAWIKALKERGIILAAVSKNEEAAALLPFGQHPDMVLRREDIAVFIANWNNKAANIALVRERLNIGFDSMVFLDDNPFERAMVRQHLPQVIVPELPEDPAQYLSYLQGLSLFEAATATAEDADRTRYYLQAAAAQESAAGFVDEAAFLRSLRMEATVSPFDAFNGPRVAQLSQRSNQFNLRTIRYTEAEVAALAAEPDTQTFAFRLRDAFGDHGLISAAVLRRAEAQTFFIENWMMSCRVLQRGMEAFVLNVLAAAARNAGAAFLLAEYLPTEKNALVHDLPRRLGFQPGADGRWLLGLSAFRPLPTFINHLPSPTHG